ncbi:uncharacterized protein LOC108668201 [Hyalella azteca]|uniref:Uncharacterized protein LOC108668201 n=1 Tax=Hyalella azteca TaxID=294128 RepID=A0A8B7NB88_HYAAZ|nr:uncharacterized protein LOC108668201 [Hyalella azteca]
MMSKKDFQEVALSLTEPGHMLLAGESTPPIPSVNRMQTPPRIKRPPQGIQICKLPRVTTCIELDRDSVSSVSTMRDFDTESLDIDTTQTELLSAISTPAQMFLAAAASKHHKKLTAKTSATIDLRLGKELTFTDRVENWERALKAALQVDAAGNALEAIAAYGKINRQVTRDAILEFEKMNSDQQKLMNDVMNCLDRRTMVLKAAQNPNSRPCSLDTTFSTGSVSTPQVTNVATAEEAPAQQKPQVAQAESPDIDPSFTELVECLKHFSTIKVLASKRKMPVVLIYGERTHRKSHRFQEKGKSNTIVYPKEKRNFLQIMGLPGKMITKKGLDFSVKPEIDSSGVRIHYSPQRSRSASTDEQREEKENNGSIIETVLDKTNNLSVTEDDGRTKRRLSAINIIKKPSVSPLPGSGGSTSQKSPGKKGKGKNSKKDKNKNKNKDLDIHTECKSMLSCDSCSSSDECESESDVCEHDIAVPSNYCHLEKLQPEPLYSADLTYVTIQLEKIGIHNTRNFISPFIRMSIRDREGDLVDGTSIQESEMGEIINKNYLRLDGTIHFQLSLQALPADIGVFLELVHHRAHLNCLSTHCYTFLEKDQLQDGEFICELYKPPVDFTREKFVAYSEKAFYLHMKLIVNNGSGVKINAQALS